MTNYNGFGTTSATFPSFAELMEEYLEPNSKEKGKYHCPVCEGHNLSVGKNGKWECYDIPTPDHRQDICNWLNDRYKEDHPLLSGGNGNGGRKVRPKSARAIKAERQKKADLESVMAAAEIEQQAQILAASFDPDYGVTLAKLTAEMADWAKRMGHDVYAAKMMLKEVVERNSQVPVTAHTSSPAHPNPDRLDVSASAVSAGDVLSQDLPEFMKQHELEEIQAKSEMGKAAFWAMVAEMESRTEISAGDGAADIARFAEWRAAVFSIADILPPGLAKAMIHDAKALAIEPMMLWQYLFVAVLSLLPKDAGLKMHSKVTPAIAYTAIVAETGTGKTRAESLIMNPLIKMQLESAKFRKADVEAYERLIKEKKGDDPDPAKPLPEEKFCFTVATIQAVWSRLADQSKHGTVWCRDELAGLFKSFGQFSKGGDNESLELILQSWDGETQFVDRMDEGKSFVLEDPRLSIAGGLQPAMYRQIFKDPDDSQGLAARFLMFHGTPMVAKNIKNATMLGTSLPGIYESIQKLGLGTVVPTEGAYALWNEARYAAEVEAIDYPSKAVAAWLRKLSGHISRIALALHTLECVYDLGKDRALLTEDTMAKAIKLGHFYRQQFEMIQVRSVEATDISSYLLKVWDFANSHPSGVTPREVLKNFSGLNKIAKESKRKPADLVLDLFAQLSEQGRGHVEVTPKSRRFISSCGATPKTSPAPPALAETSSLSGFGCAGEDVCAVTGTCEFEADQTVCDSIEMAEMAVEDGDIEGIKSILHVLSSIGEDDPSLKKKIWNGLSEKAKTAFKLHSNGKTDLKKLNE
jgi:hypothetical protein